MKRKIAYVFAALIFLAGLSLLLYPLTANKWNSYRQSHLITGYTKTVEAEVETGTISYQNEWEEARAYNASLLPMILPDAFAEAEVKKDESRRYLSCLNLNGNGMMGYIEIPKIEIEIPIFHTTDEEILQKGAGHLEGSSLPVGGGSTHSVISAHRGLPSASLFTDLDRMEEGDHFLIHILDDTLCYEVDQIKVVEPQETEDLAVIEGEDLVTLMTCTPYGVNSHRLLVRGHRVPLEELVDEETPAGLINTSLHTNYLLWVIIGLAVTGSFILILFFLDRRKR